jgi:imidazolonepropionase-like amidohydrolase
MITVLRNATIFDGTSEELRSGHVVVEDERIAEVSDSPPRHGTDWAVIDVHGNTVMPGLIDAHVHAYTPHVNCTIGDQMPMTLVAHWARRVLERWLRRGFTTVRDTGGADQGLSRAIDCGWIDGPRLLYCGKALTQTGGGGDFRDPEDHSCGCGCAGYIGSVTRAVDGPEGLRSAVREEFRRGASFIKILASGAVAAPSNALERLEFSDEEIAAIVEETTRYGSYVTAHVHPDAAIRRCIELGVPCIEHASMITDTSAALAAARGASVVPTMAVVWALSRHGAEIGVPPGFLEKLSHVEPLMLQTGELLKRAGVRTGFGTDCLGELDEHQCVEFTIRKDIWQPVEILRQATSINAEILGLEELGRVAPGLIADLIVVAGNPLDELGLFTSDGRNIPVIIKAGRAIKNEL